MRLKYNNNSLHKTMSTCLCQYKSGINQGTFCGKAIAFGNKYCDYCMKICICIREENEIQEGFAALKIEEKKHIVHGQCRYFGGANQCVVTPQDTNTCCYGHAMNLSTISNVQLNMPKVTELNTIYPPEMDPQEFKGYGWYTYPPANPNQILVRIFSSSEFGLMYFYKSETKTN